MNSRGFHPPGSRNPQSSTPEGWSHRRGGRQPEMGLPLRGRDRPAVVRGYARSSHTPGYSWRIALRFARTFTQANSGDFNTIARTADVPIVKTAITAGCYITDRSHAIPLRRRLAALLRRKTALAVVPAKWLHAGAVDGNFSRLGAADRLLPSSVSPQFSRLRGGDAPCVRAGESLLPAPLPQLPYPGACRYHLPSPSSQGQ